jgi:hypothetical protein
MSLLAFRQMQSCIAQAVRGQPGHAVSFQRVARSNIRSAMDAA